MFGALKQSKLFGDAFWALFGQAASALALLLGMRLLTELVSPAVYGQVALLNGFVALGVAVFSYPFICAGMRIVPECETAGQSTGLHAAVAGLTLQATMLAIGLLVLGGFAYGYFVEVSSVLFLLTGVLLAMTVQRELGIQLAIGERKQRLASLWQTTDSVLRPALAIALVWWWGGNPEWVLLGYILASLLSNLVWIVLKRRNAVRMPATDSRSFRREVWVYALPLIPMELIFWINGLGDRYVIGYLLTAADVGLYAATYMIVNEAFNRSAMVLLRTFQPAYFQAFSAQQLQKAFSILWVWITSVAALGAFGLLLLLLTKDWVASLVLAKSYHAAVDLMPAMALGCALHALGTALAQPLLAHKRTKTLLKGRLCGAVAAAVTIPVLVSQYGLPGAAWANPVYFGIEAVVLAILAKPWQADRRAKSGTIQTLRQQPLAADA
ncbi:lipopolysaccharide biosynthesis protein [Methylomonas sp. LW13]|uniref:lipopolysaccharide biosynthesis protein n=1 Tax=unclassified Methylomonas TaxID=2608980 RepID=UPI00051C221E|nr:lipopolysaccharide biosynthesis protein [Methylomonas sp. LW13]QBC26298.1 lipopolysaccharide biosynthesis protein [Methylomonas sp. LW13]